MKLSSGTSTLSAAVRLWRAELGVLTLAHAIGTLGMMSVLALAPVIQEDLGFSATAFGLLVAVYAGAQAVISPFVGQMADRVGVGQTLMLSMVFVAVGAALFSSCWQLSVGLLAAAALGTGYSFINPATAKGVMDWAPTGRRATGMGIKQTGVPLGGMLAAGAALVAGLLGWRGTLLCVAAIALLTVLPCWWLVQPQAGPKAAVRSIRATWPTLLLNRNLGSISIATAGFNMCQASFFGFLTLFVENAIGVGHVTSGLCLGIAQAMSALGRICWGIVGDRHFMGRRKWLYAYIGVASCALFLAFAWMHQAWVAVAIATAALLGFTVGSYAALVQAMVVETVSPDDAGAASGYHQSVISLGGMLGPPLFGALVDSSGSFAVGWIFLAGLCALSTTVLVAGFSEHRQWNDMRRQTGWWSQG